MSLLRQLKRDLELSGHEDLLKISEEISRAQKTPGHLLIDKIESLMVILVRLSFIGMKFVIPLTTLAYHKFKNNDMMIFNNKNFNRLLSFLIKFMEALESKLSSEKLNVYQYGSSSDHGHKDAASEAITDVPNNAIESSETPQIEGIMSAEPSFGTSQSWSRLALKLTLKHFFGIGTSEEAKDYATDPRFAQYFSERRMLVDGDSLFDKDEVFSDTRTNPSFLNIAQQFADQMS